MDIVLEDPSFHYLRGQFSQRPNPRASRFFYALSTLEDATLQEFERTLAAECPAAHIMVYMFDEAIVKVPASSKETLWAIAADTARWPVQWTIDVVSA